MVQRMMKKVLRIFSQLYKFGVGFYAHPTIRLVLGRARFCYFRFANGISTFNVASESEFIRPKTICHNLSAFENISTDFSMRRMLMLIYATLAVETLPQDASILVIGPRTENDILLLHGLGYVKTRGLDLISYSPFIFLGDMHEIPFKDSEFDAVICGWTLSYSMTPKLALAEMVRVLKHDGLLSIGIEHVNFLINLSNDDRSEVLRDPRLIDPDSESTRINNCNQIILLLGAHAGTVYFNHDAPLRSQAVSKIKEINGLSSSQVMLVVSVKK